MKMARLNYTFQENEVVGVDVGFEDWSNEAVQYNITVKLSTEDANLAELSPAQLAEVAATKVAHIVTGI